MTEPIHPNQLRPGDRIRDYQFVRRLGVGGYAFVFLVERQGRHFSLKMAAQPASGEDEDRVDAWMRREVASLEHLEDPHLLPVLERGRWPDTETGYAYFITPYVTGNTFHVWRWRERAPLHRSVGVLCEHLRTLEALHTRGVCHRDIKADNILVRQEDDRPFLIDFGAAHLPGAKAVTEGLAPGTLYCQPPEAIAFLVSEAVRHGSRLEAHPTADLYAFGVLLYETLTNCRPFSTHLALDALLVAIATQQPVPPRNLAPEAPDSLCALALSLMDKEPARRPQSARAVREELEELLRREGQTSRWREPAKLPSECGWVRESFSDVDLMADPQPEAIPSVPRPPGVRARGGSRTARRLAALGLGLGLLGLGWALLHATYDPPPEGDPREEATAPARPAPSDRGPQPVPTHPETSVVPLPNSRLCLLLGMLGGAAPFFTGCATLPVRPDPERYLAQCPPEAKETPVRLGIEPDEQASWLRTGTAASDETIEDGGSLNIRSGPVMAEMGVYVKGQETYFKITGEAVATPNRLYMQFDRLHLPDGTSLPICGVALDGKHQYGIPTYALTPFHGAKVDPARVDKTPGSVVLNDPRFETLLQGPEGYYETIARLAPPDYR
ncbi:protein kinase domain-containing protein [Melittangium boletus]|uniref:Protein kinase domain-containing protein n=1 Tax=Melittangium boletus DSM 14713 TaxID=1294270 RepID=A0A250I8C3_9BACT|nr:protein kinase [Melittangium boletus]ATB27453.1 hypothetical protein MEBOL_000895 [Melittangium boletus DSM 14713]